VERYSDVKWRNGDAKGIGTLLNLSLPREERVPAGRFAQVVDWEGEILDGRG
jgi:hypothetical protein